MLDGAIVTEMTRIRKALERIAVATERQVAADPLTMLQELAEETVMQGEMQQPFASNGFIHMYQLPDAPEWHVVARRDANEPSGYTVAVERT